VKIKAFGREIISGVSITCHIFNRWHSLSVSSKNGQNCVF